KNLHHEEAVQLGERLLDRALAGYELDSSDLPIERVVSTLARNGYSDFDELLADIGLGNRLAPLVARELLGEREAVVNGDEDKRKPLPIRGTEGLLVSYAKCCLPLPGDHIVGHLSAGRGIVVHRDSCKNLLAEMRNNPEKCLALYWDSDVKQEFSTALRIELVNKKGILATLGTKLSELNSNIETLNMTEKDASVTIINLTITVQDRIHLARVIKRIRPLPNVVRISRISA